MQRPSPLKLQLFLHLHLARSLDLEEVFVLPQRRSLEEEQIIFVPTVDLRTTCWLSVPFSSNQALSPTVFVTVHGPLGKVKVLALLDTNADAKFIKKDLADTLGLPLYGSLDVKV
ncbi:hypothetical protein DSO57_1020201 [Entomophthora muscae]|uniref:Uncharacterized protein n=1 Tax=Entomophthora muscae TaxID=34485 RepID=A0ACC2SGJ3_9FUNG|nr:hypothetical protein DSO57_1020201 [Entomophthora muscae]